MSAETEPGRRSVQRLLNTRRRAFEPGSQSTIGHELSGVPRRYGQWSAAVLFVVLAVLAAGWLWQQHSDRVEILTVNRAVSAGSVIERSDLAVADVAGLDAAIPAARVDTVTGQVAAVPLVQGQVLTTGMVSAPLPGAGQRVVGVELDATRAPSGLRPGDLVVVLAVPPSGDAGSPAELEAPTVLADKATIVSVEHIEGAGNRLSLLLDKSAADQVASFGAAGRVALVQTPLGGH